MQRDVAGFSAATINVPRKVGRLAWEHCWEETADRASVFVVNETLTRRQRNVYRDLTREHGWKQRGLWDSPNPVFFDPEVWSVGAHNTYRLHARLRWWRRWPGYDAARYANVTALTHRHADWLHVTPIGTHLVPRGRKVPADARKRARAKSVSMLNTIVSRQLNLDRVALPMGDMNWEPENFHLDHVEWLLPGIDQVGIALPKGFRLTDRAVGRFRAPTDHKYGRVVSIQLERTSR